MRTIMNLVAALTMFGALAVAGSPAGQNCCPAGACCKAGQRKDGDCKGDYWKIGQRKAGHRKEGIP